MCDAVSHGDRTRHLSQHTPHAAPLMGTHRCTVIIQYRNAVPHSDTSRSAPHAARIAFNIARAHRTAPRIRV